MLVCSSKQGLAQNNHYLRFCLICLLHLTAPKIEPFRPKYKNVIGSKFKLQCYLSHGSFKPVRFEWFQNGQSLASANPRYRIETKDDESTLTIDHLEVVDSSNISCSVQTQFGTDRSDTTLELLGSLSTFLN